MENPDHAVGTDVDRTIECAQTFRLERCDDKAGEFTVGPGQAPAERQQNSSTARTEERRVGHKPDLRRACQFLEEEVIGPRLSDSIRDGGMYDPPALIGDRERTDTGQCVEGRSELRFPRFRGSRGAYPFAKTRQLREGDV